MANQNRQLAAILFTDIVGYTAMMQQDESQAVAMMKHYIQVLKEKVSEHNGQILNDYGDGSLCVFPSATEALKASVKIQKDLQSEPAVPLRIGLHLGEIFFEDEKVMGDSINVASRIQSLGQANTILFSGEIAGKLKNQPEFKTVSLGSFHFKNVDEPMEVFALTGEGLKVPKREEMSGKLKEMNKKVAAKKLIATFAIIVLLAAALFIFNKNSGNKGFKGERSIAVLPFENSETASIDESLSDDITRDIINNLSKITSLQKVIAWFSVRSLKKTTRSFKEIADELGVAAILSGTIQIKNGKIRIVTELIEVSSNNRLWGDDFEYDGNDILAIQSRVASEIVAALSANVTEEDRKKLAKNYTENVEAYKLYRKGRSFWDRRTRESYDSAEAYYKKAIDLDPDYALAYAGLADCYTFNQKGLLQTEAIPIAKIYAQKALSIDSTLVEAQTTLAFIQSHYDFDWAGAKLKFEKIIGDNPNYPVAHLYYGNVLLFTGNTEPGLAETKKALSLDPLSFAFNHVLGRNLYLARKYDSAEIQLKKALTLNPKFVSTIQYLGEIYLQKKSYTQALSIFSSLPPGQFDQGANGTIAVSLGNTVSGNITKSRELLGKFSQDSLGRFPIYAAGCYAAMGDRDNAVKCLELGFRDRSLSLIFLNTHPLLDPIRNDPRFNILLKKMNFL